MHFNFEFDETYKKFRFKMLFFNLVIVKTDSYLSQPQNPTTSEPYL